MSKGIRWGRSLGAGWLVLWGLVMVGCAADRPGVSVRRQPVVVAPEWPTDPPLAGVSIANQESPAVASDGKQFFVVWRDFRNGSHHDIYGARVSATGTVLDPTNIPICTEAASQDRPDVAFDGVNYWVVWETFAGQSRFDIAGARVSPAGVLLDPRPVVISRAVGDQISVRATRMGNEVLAVWEDRRSLASYHIYGARLARTGKLLDAAGIAINVFGKNKKNPAVWGTSTGALVAWTDTRPSTHTDIYGARIDKAGKVLDATGLGIARSTANQSFPAVSGDGSRYRVTWQESAGTSAGGRIFGAWVSAAGVVSPSVPRPVGPTRGGQDMAQTAFSSSRHLVVWQDRSGGPVPDIFGARVDTTGSVLDSASLAICRTTGYQQQPRVAAAAGFWLVVWQDRRSNLSYDIRATRVSDQGKIIDINNLHVSGAANSQVMPVAAHDGSRYLVVWRDQLSSAAAQIHGVRFSATGLPLDKRAVVLSSSALDKGLPTVAGHNGRFLVVWGERASQWDLRAARVDGATGARLDSINLCGAAGDQRYPSVAHDGKTFVAAWQDSRTSSAAPDIVAARVADQNGQVLDSGGFVVSAGSGFSGRPALAAGSGGSLVVWQDRLAGGVFTVRGARMDRAGKVVDTRGIAVSHGTGNRWYPSVAFDGSRYWVAWQDHRSTTSGADIYAARLDPARGTVLDSAGIRVSRGAGNELAPRLATTPGLVQLVWQQTGTTSGHDIWGAELWRSGVLRSGSTAALVAGTANEHAPTLASGGGWAMLLTYHRFDPNPGLSSLRAKVRLLSWTALGSACTEHGHCRSGYCLKGVCTPLPDGGLPPDSRPIPDMPPPDLSPDRGQDLPTPDLTLDRAADRQLLDQPPPRPDGQTAPPDKQQPDMDPPFIRRAPGLGCGCHTAVHGTSSVWLLLGLVLVLGWLRRRV